MQTINDILTDYNLRECNTLRLPSSAQQCIVIADESGLEFAVNYAKQHDLSLSIIGGGSNVVLAEELPGLTLLIRIPGIHYHGTEVIVGAGVVWHDFVLDTLAHDLSGLENLSLIPGFAGAAPIQNIGAYGQELSSVISSVRAYDSELLRWVNLSRGDCQFQYRHSIFRGSSRYIISSVTLSLSATFHPLIDYPGVTEELTRDNIVSPAALDVSHAVCSLRRKKLPDPAAFPNVGSFFKNPVISRDQYVQLREVYEDLTGWEQPDGQVKVSAAGIIDRLGLKGERLGGAEVSTQHSLVIINQGSATFSHVEGLAKKVQDLVLNELLIHLDIEPVMLPYT